MLVTIPDLDSRASMKVHSTRVKISRQEVIEIADPFVWVKSESKIRDSVVRDLCVRDSINRVLRNDDGLKTLDKMILASKSCETFTSVDRIWTKIDSVSGS